MIEHPGKLRTKAVPGAPRVGSRVSPGVVPRPSTKGAESKATPDRYTRFRSRAARIAASYGRV